MDRKMTVKSIKISFYILSLAYILASCSSISKNMEYFQGIDTADLSGSRGLYDARIMPKDELTINVSTSDPKVSEQFSITPTTRSTGRGDIPYLVENDGTINFPLVGRINVSGLTKRECEDKICGLIKPYLANGENPVVTVEMSSYHVTVLGEVGSSGVKTVTGNKISIIEAIAQAGDLTVYGRRDNILIIREDARGEKHPHRLNINDPNIINSPYYYLQQNDIVYVTPNKIKARNVDVNSHTSLVMTIIGFTTSLASLALGIANLK